MTGNGTSDSPYIISTYNDFISYLTEYNPRVIPGDTSAIQEEYYELANDIECRTQVLKDARVVIKDPDVDETDSVTYYTKILDMKNFAIRNFYMVNCQIFTVWTENATFRIHNGIIDSWVIRNSTLCQSLTDVVGMVFENCSCSMIMVGEPIKTVPSSIGSITIPSISSYMSSLSTITSNINYDRTQYTVYSGSMYQSKACGNCVKFKKSKLKLKYYPNISYYRNYDASMVYTSMIKQIQIDNTEAEIYCSRSPFCASSIAAGSQFGAIFGIQIINNSDVTFIVNNMLMIQNYGTYWFQKVQDSIIKIYTKHRFDVNLNNVDTYGSTFTFYIVPIDVTSSYCLGNNAVYFHNYSYQSLVKLVNYSNTSSTLALTSDPANISDPEWLLERGIICVDNRTSTTSLSEEDGE